MLEGSESLQRAFHTVPCFSVCDENSEYKFSLIYIKSFSSLVTLPSYKGLLSHYFINQEFCSYKAFYMPYFM